MQHYEKCWKERNKIKCKPEIQRRYVLEWHEKQVINGKMHWSENVRKYVREYELNTDDRSTDYT